MVRFPQRRRRCRIHPTSAIGILPKKDSPAVAIERIGADFGFPAIGILREPKVSEQPGTPPKALSLPLSLI
jgi:hypothetical protein